MIYYINVDVSFVMPMKDISGMHFVSAKPMIGFMQEFGCTAESLHAAKEMVDEHIFTEIPMAKIKAIEYDWSGVIQEAEIHKEIYGDKDIASRLLADPLKNGIWYHTGHAFYF